MLLALLIAGKMLMGTGGDRPNREEKICGKQHFWRDKKEEMGYRLQYSLLDGHARILDKNNIRKATGTMSAMEENMELPRDFHADKVLKMSAKTGEGIEDLKKTIEDILQNQRVYLEHVFPYKDAGKIAIVRKFGEILSEEYIDEGISIKAYIPAEIFGKVIST